ncbi:putative DNA-binding regulatory protein [Streptomyces scabiei 87.22]|uniref:Putative DNA-binding regulatory protein n=1 Tax=Streptomyces scabiei (strain 87.22) TaxID=680198 RepID=C9YUP3_STRSW|nr:MULTISPECIES: helix-turn-helix domain-containing protein [Streptomyces]MBP5860403.1 helix-turn-helix domain-containing protein [Streptomyces sp. LBUM 1484]MBP5903053.1 helix-turn-helix domain-containing protein [Streptomyces sp. LBUM 1488]MDX2576648.1 helix-turn-helix domain-containing protein [Streptomyces scabiei]MDX2652576.1 helix-turn-helix domain-containing protein [Streptomyces scabiei]MDX2720930.1 helix-turn-helix domain-containing protein [Streptomyces scabiei]
MPAGSYSVEALTTEEVNPRERADFWTERIGSYQSRMGFGYARSDDFRGETVRQRTDTYQLVKYRSDEIEYTRTMRQVHRDPDEDYRLLLPMSGEIVLRQDGGEARLTPGTAALVTFAAPFQCLQSDAIDAFVLTIPAREVDGRLGTRSPVASGLDLTTGLGRIVGSMLTGLHEEREHLSDAEFNAVSDRVVELVCMLTAGDDRPDAPGQLGEVEALVRRYVRDHVADPNLTGTAVARALGWSLRQIQLALQQAGTTPRELIREERLRLVRDRLLCAECEHMTITDLAYAAGFSSASALSTAFRRRYDVSPREMRQSARRPNCGANR